MFSTRMIERRWIENFKRTPLVEKETGIFQKQCAYQLFYGKQSDSYPTDYPHNFQEFYNCSTTTEKEAVINDLIRYLHFIGIKIRKQVISNHLRIFPDDFSKLIRKSYYIFKTLAHSSERLDTNNPFLENTNDIFFFLQIESEESTESGDLYLFEDMELGDLYKRFATLPLNYEEKPGIKDLFSKIENSNDSFCITGKAGSGKSTFIRYFIQKTRKRILLTSYTGTVALNLGGQTLHSFFRFPLKPLLLEDNDIPLFREYTQQRRIMEKVDTIVIDEISMVRADMMQSIDYCLRRNGGNPDEPFGGKQLIFIGDPFQLSPIVNLRNEVEKFLFREVYQSEYFFDSIAYKNLAPYCLEFKKAYNHDCDPELMKLLESIRSGKADNHTLATLNSCYERDYVPKPDEFVIKLTSNNSLAQAENIRKLRELKYPRFILEAEITGVFSTDKYPTSKVLTLKRNAQVIFIKDDVAGRWVKGTIAKIDFISNDLLEVRMPDGNVYSLKKEEWENRRYKYDRRTRRIVSEVIGTFTQYPIKLAWAVTVYKSQGLLFDNVIIDSCTGPFANGHLYTALSRCRSLEGITFKKKLRMKDLIADPRIIRFYENQKGLVKIRDEEGVAT